MALRLDVILELEPLNTRAHYNRKPMLSVFRGAGLATNETSKGVVGFKH